MSERFRKVQVSDFQPDWTKYGTAAKMEEQLVGFKFSGPGWYHHRGDTLLVVAANEVPRSNVWHQKWPEDTVFYYAVWNGRNPMDAFNALVNAPTRKDE